MEDKNDLFQGFKNRAQELNEQPRAEAWQKLERKLAQRRGKRKKMQIIRTWSMAAMITLLVGAIYIFANFLTNPNTPLVALDAIPEQIEELNYPENDLTSYRVLVGYRKKMTDNNSTQIKEGKGKKLMVLNGKRVEKLPKVEKRDTLKRDSTKL